MKKWITKLYLKIMGYDDLMLWKYSDRFKVTKRYSNGREEFILTTNDKYQHINVYKNDKYETSLRIP